MRAGRRHSQCTSCDIVGPRGTGRGEGYEATRELATMDKVIRMRINGKKDASDMGLVKVRRKEDVKEYDGGAGVGS